MDRSARTLVAVAFFTIAAFLSADLLIQRAPLNAWILPGILTLLGLIFIWLSVRPERGPAETMDEPEASTSLTPALAEGVQVYEVVRVPAPSAPAPALEAPAAEEGDDLTMIDGIGPKTSEALKAAGVTTFAALGELKPEAITEALHMEGARAGGNVETWPHQARLAARGDWSGLRRYVSGLKADQTDDLLVLDGVGPKISDALKAADVGTFAAISEKTPDELRAILQSADVPVVGNSIDTWPRQAKLAAAEDWPGLMRYIAETKKVETVASDDLLILDGVGPKTADALKAAGVGTFAAVSEKTPDELRAILQEAGVAVVGSSIDTWPQQAKYAAAEDWPAMMRYISETKKSESGE